MKNKIDLIIIFLGYLNELLILFLFKYSQILMIISPAIKMTDIFIKYRETQIIFYIGKSMTFLFYILGFIYCLDVIAMYRSNEFVEIKRNTIYLFSLLLCDYILFLFNFRAILLDSYAFRFIVICLLTNLVVYIKYKKNNIKIK